MIAPRIVSLLASATEIVDALGLGGQLVGISHECDHPPHLLDRPRLSRPRFDPEGLSSAEIDSAVRAAMREHGSVYRIDAELLERLAPGLVLTQAVCEVCAVPTPGVEQVVRGRGIDARVLSLDAHTLDDILDTIRQVGRAAGVPDRADEVVSGLARRLDAVAAAVRDAPVPRVLAIEWLDPPFSPGHWVPEQIERAGGACVLGRAGEHSRQVEWADLAGLDPDVLIVMPCGYGLAASLAEADAHAAKLREFAPRAVDAGRAFAVDGSSFFNRSGPRAIRGVEILAGLLHPERWPAPEEREARVWPSG